LKGALRLALAVAAVAAAQAWRGTFAAAQCHAATAVVKGSAASGQSAAPAAAASEQSSAPFAGRDAKC
jgi:hypothetical protein